MAKHRIDLQLFAVNSEEYWRNREEENLKNNLKSEEEYDKRLKEIYQNMLDGCQSEINAFYGRYASKENISIAEAKKRVSELDIKAYERKAKRYVKKKDFSKEANEEMRLYNLTMKVNRLEMLKANIGLELIAGHDELNKFMGEILKGRTKAELKRQAGILGKTITNNAQKADAIVNGSFQNATFSQRIWMYQDALRSDLDKLLQSGLIQGKNPRELAKTLRRTFDTTIYNAERLMRTELARVQTEAQKQSFQRNGYSMYTYHCIGNDGKTCSTCKGLNGKHFKVEDMLPGTNASPMHPNCRCSCSAYEDSEEYEAWLDYLDKGGTTENFHKMRAKSDTLTNRRKERMAARRAKATTPDFNKMDKTQLEKWASKNLKTKFESAKGVNTDFLRETIKVLSKFEGKMGGTVEGLSVRYGGLESGVYAKYDDKTKTLLLKKTGSITVFEEKQKEANARYRIKWKRDKDYYATTTYSGTVLHELGHVIDMDAGQELSKKLGSNKSLYEDAIKVSVYAGSTQNVRVTKASEAWAENFAAYMEGNENAKKVPNEVKTMIEEYFKRKK